MTDLRAAAQQALEAWQTSSYGQPSHQKAMVLAMTNLRAALAEPVQEQCKGDPGECEFNGGCMYACAKPEPLYAAPEPQEPVAWRYELATTMLEHGYDSWTHRVTRHKPNAPEGSIRNLTSLCTAPEHFGVGE